MAKVYEFLAEGFEEIEALIPVDVMRRGGVEIKTVSITGSELVTSSHGVVIKADQLWEDTDLSDADLLLLPGGLPGATNLNEHEGLKAALVAHCKAGKLIGAICAAPLVLGGLGLLQGKHATCYPGFEGTLEGAHYTADLYTDDGNITTGEGPAATLPYAYALLSKLTDHDNAVNVAGGMRYLHLIQS